MNKETTNTRLLLGVILILGLSIVAASFSYCTNPELARIQAEAPKRTIDDLATCEHRLGRAYQQLTLDKTAK